MTIELSKGDAMFLRNIYQQILKTNRQELEDDEYAFIKDQQKKIDDMIHQSDLESLGRIDYHPPFECEEDATNPAYDGPMGIFTDYDGENE
jgi:hypothetical protein